MCEVPERRVGAIELSKIMKNIHLEEIERCDSPVTIEHGVQQEDQDDGDYREDREMDNSDYSIMLKYG